MQDISQVIEDLRHVLAYYGHQREEIFAESVACYLGEKEDALDEKQKGEHKRYQKEVTEALMVFFHHKPWNDNISVKAEIYLEILEQMDTGANVADSCAVPDICCKVIERRSRQYRLF